MSDPTTPGSAAYCPTCRVDVPVTRPAPPYSVHHDLETSEHHEAEDCHVR